MTGAPDCTHAADLRGEVPPDLPLSARLGRLQARFEARYRELGRRLYAEDDDCRAYGQSLLRAYRATVGQPALARRARALTEFAATFPLRFDPDDLLAGQQTFCPPEVCADFSLQELRALGWADNGGHVVHDYEVLLRRGISGLAADLACVRACLPSVTSPMEGDAWGEALSAFRLFIQRHAQACPDPLLAVDLRRLANSPPQTFRQALQLVWLAQVFVHAENPSAALSFGRLDQYLWPFLREDLAAGRTTWPQAQDLVGAFYLQCCAGDESQNLVVGGVDRTGRDATNPLSILLLRVMRELRSFQPSLCVRVHDATPAQLWEEAGELAAVGDGQPGFLNDRVVIPALESVGIAPADAADYAIVGCYETVPQGAAWANTVAGCLHLPDLLSDSLATPAARQATDFSAFLAGWRERMRTAWEQERRRLQEQWNRKRDLAPSPFGSLLMRGCVEHLTPMEAGGAQYSLMGVNLLGLGTLVDGLHAVRALVYDEPSLTVAELAAAIAEDFPNETLRRRLLHLPGRYGTDTRATNALAAEVSEFLARMILDSRLDNGVRLYPGFFRFSGDIYGGKRASADGRRAGDLLSYGVAPSGAVEASLTSALRSAAHVRHKLCACGNPFSVSLASADLRRAGGGRLIRDLVEGYFALGGFHLHFNTLSPEELRRAQAHPEQFAHLTVRVSGYSARFVKVDPRWQEAIIERAEKGR